MSRFYRRFTIGVLHSLFARNFSRQRKKRVASRFSCLHDLSCPIIVGQLARGLLRSSEFFLVFFFFSFFIGVSRSAWEIVLKNRADNSSLEQIFKFHGISSRRARGSSATWGTWRTGRVPLIIAILCLLGTNYANYARSYLKQVFKKQLE